MSTIGSIRTFDRKRDFHRILLLEIERFDDPMNAQMINSLISRYGTEYFYIVDINLDDQLNGFLFAGLAKHDTIHIFSIAIEKKYEGKGWGKRLLKYLIENSPATVRKIILQVETTNQRAYSLYRELGFKKVKIVRDYYGSKRDALVMQLEM